MVSAKSIFLDDLFSVCRRLFSLGNGALCHCLFRADNNFFFGRAAVCQRLSLKRCLCRCVLIAGRADLRGWRQVRRDGTLPVTIVCSAPEDPCFRRASAEVGSRICGRNDRWKGLTSRLNGVRFSKIRGTVLEKSKPRRGYTQPYFRHRGVRVRVDQSAWLSYSTLKKNACIMSC